MDISDIPPGLIVQGPEYGVHSASANYRRGNLTSQDGQVQVTLKTPRSQANDQATLTQLRNEIQYEADVLSSLDHPNIVRFYGTWQGPGADLPSLVFSFYSRRVIDVIKSIRQEKRLDLVIQITSALSFLHQMSISHGDIQPAGVFVDDGGHAILTEFGRARDPDVAGWKAGCNWRYMAPEALNPASNAHISPFAADVWSLGVSAVEILSGRSAFGSRVTDTAFLIHVVTPDRARFPEISDQVWHLLEQCWNRNPDQRPSAFDLYQSLRSLI